MDRITANTSTNAAKRSSGEIEGERSTKRPSVNTFSSSSFPVVNEGGASEQVETAAFLAQSMGVVVTQISSLEQVQQKCITLCEKVQSGTGISPEETELLKQLSQRMVSEFSSTQLTEATGAEEGAVVVGSAFTDEPTTNSFNCTEDCIPLFEKAGSKTCIAKDQYRIED